MVCERTGGIEQGFTISRAPGEPHGRPLTVSLALSERFTTKLDPDKAGAEITSPSGPAKLTVRRFIVYWQRNLEPNFSIIKIKFEVAQVKPIVSTAYRLTRCLEPKRCEEYG